MDRFIELVKKSLTRQMSVAEKAEFDRLLENNEDLHFVNQTLFAKKSRNEKADVLDAEKAYAVHVVKMQLQSKLD